MKTSRNTAQLKLTTGDGASIVTKSFIRRCRLDVALQKSLEWWKVKKISHSSTQLTRTRLDLWKLTTVNLCALMRTCNFEETITLIRQACSRSSLRNATQTWGHAGQSKRLQSGWNASSSSYWRTNRGSMRQSSLSNQQLCQSHVSRGIQYQAVRDLRFRRT